MDDGLSARAAAAFAAEQRKYFSLLGQRVVRKRIAERAWDEPEMAAARDWLADRASAKSRKPWVYSATIGALSVAGVGFAARGLWQVVLALHWLQ